MFFAIPPFIHHNRTSSIQYQLVKSHEHILKIDMSVLFTEITEKNIDCRRTHTKKWKCSNLIKSPVLCWLLDEYQHNSTMLQEFHFHWEYMNLPQWQKAIRTLYNIIIINNNVIFILFLARIVGGSTSMDPESFEPWVCYGLCYKWSSEMLSSLGQIVLLQKWQSWWFHHIIKIVGMIW